MNEMNFFDATETTSDIKIPNESKVSLSFKRLWDKVPLDFREKRMIPMSEKYGFHEENDSIIDGTFVRPVEQLLKAGEDIWLIDKMDCDKIDLYLRTGMECDDFLLFYDKKKLHSYVSNECLSILKNSVFTYETLGSCNDMEIKILLDLVSRDLIPDWLQDSLDDIRLLIKLVQMQGIKDIASRKYFLKTCTRDIANQAISDEGASTDPALIFLKNYFVARQGGEIFDNSHVVAKMFNSIHYSTCDWVILAGDDWFFKFPIAYSVDMIDLVTDFFNNQQGYFWSQQYQNKMLMIAITNANDFRLSSWYREKVPTLDWSSDDPLYTYCLQFFEKDEVDSWSVAERILKLSVKGVFQ